MAKSKSTEVATQSSPSNINFIDKDYIKEINSKLNAEPPKKLVKTRNVGTKNKPKEYRYVPIGAAEEILDDIFEGGWQLTDFKWEVIANEVVGTITLSVFHQGFGTWISRTGTGAAIIRQTSGAKVTDIEAKYTNALVADFPHLEAQCINSAVRKFGKIFGRYLNRTATGIEEGYDTPTEVDEAAAQAAFKQKVEQANAQLYADSWARYQSAVLSGKATYEMPKLRQFEGIFKERGLNKELAEVVKAIKLVEEHGNG